MDLLENFDKVKWISRDNWVQDGSYPQDIYFWQNKPRKQYIQKDNKEWHYQRYKEMQNEVCFEININEFKKLFGFVLRKGKCYKIIDINVQVVTKLLIEKKRKKISRFQLLDIKD